MSKSEEELINNNEIIIPPKDENIQNKTTKSKISLIQQLKINKAGLNIFLFNALIFITYNININHLYFGYFTKKIGLIQCFLLLIFIGTFSILFQINLIKKLEINNEDTLSAMIQEHFGLLCSQLFEILCFLWVIFNFLITFLTYFHFIIISFFENEDQFKFSNNWFSCIIIMIIFIIVFLIINSLENSSVIDINIILNFLLDIFSILLMGKKLYLGIRDNKIKGKIWENNFDENQFIKAICIFSNSFHSLLVLFYVNKKLKLSLYPILEHKKILWINHIMIFLFYSFYIFQGYFDVFEDNDYEYLLSIIINNTNAKIEDYSLIICNILSQILNINFYLYTIKNSILRNSVQIQFKNKISVFMFTLLILIIFTVFGGFCYFNQVSTYNLSLINNSSFGLLVNFLFPFLFILKYHLRYSSYFLLSVIFLVSSVCLIPLYEVIQDFLLYYKIIG